MESHTVFSLCWQRRKKTKVHRKPTHMQQYINRNSNHPKNMLLGVLQGLIHRSHVLCDKKEDLLEELGLVRNVFISNVYPDHCFLQPEKSLRVRKLERRL